MPYGTVTVFYPEDGWGVIASPDLPDGQEAWVHYSSIEMEGYRALEAGDRVEFDFERVDQDGYRFSTTRVRKI